MNRRQRRRRAQIRNLFLIGPPALLVVLWLAGFALPDVHREEVRLFLPSTAETVWAVLTDLDGMPDWRRDLVELERLPDGDAGGRWREVETQGQASAFEWVESVAPSRLVVRQVGSPTNERRWICRIVRAERGVEVALVEEHRISNPLRRSLAGLLGSNRDRIDGLARDLGHRLNIRRQLAADLKR